MVTDCETEWPPEIPPFPVITIRVGDGLPPPWGDRGANKVITIEDRDAQIERSMARRKRAMARAIGERRSRRGGGAR